MPNHVTNIITTTPEVAEALIYVYTDEDRAENAKQQADMAARYKERTGKDWSYPPEVLPERRVTFTKLLPIPDDDDPIFTASHSTFPGGGSAWSMDGYSPLEWAREHWGTKWDAYDSEITPLEGDRVELRFDTAWSHPSPVIEALVEKFPEATIKVSFADEDLGSNCGSYEIEAGEPTNFYQPDYGPESLDFAAQIKYGMSYAEVRKEWGEEDEDEEVDE